MELSPVRHRPVGPRATAAWLLARGIYVPPTLTWEVTIAMDSGTARPAAQINIALDSLEWGFLFTCETGTSWIRVLEAPTVHDKDDFALVDKTPALRNLGTLVRQIEHRFELEFRRTHAAIHTNLANADDKIRAWVVASL